MSNFPDNDTSGLDRSSGPQKKQSNPPANPTRTLPTTNPNAVSKQPLPLTIPDRIRLYEKPHRKLREFVMEGLVQVRDELLPLLYYSYVRLYMKIIVEKLPRDSVRKWKNDFLHVESYMKEINYLENMGTVSEERIREDPMLHQMIAVAKTISLSQFTFESLFLFIQKNNLQEIDFDVLQSMKINLKIVTDTPSEADKKLPKPLFMTPAKDVLKMSEGSGRIGVRLDEALFMHLLQSLSDVKKSGETDLSSQNLFKYIPSFKGDIQDGKTIPLPEQSLDYQLDFAHAFLDRPILNQQTEPNVLHITVRDPEENVTCVEIDPQGQVMLVGFNNAKILMVILNPKFKEKTTEYEEYKQSSTEDLITALDMDPITFDAGDFYEQEDSAMEEEQEEQNGVVGDDENGIDGDKMFKQRAKKEKYEIVEFLGHEDAITSLNLHFDGLYFLSCSVDTTIRLWCVRQRVCLNIFKGHINTVWTAKFACRGLFFVSGSSDTTARVWVTGHLVPIRSFLGHTSDVNLVEYSQDCNNIVTASYDKSIRIWDVDSTRCLKILYPGSEIISSIGLNYYSNMLVSGLNDGTFVLWDIHNDLKVGTFTLANNDKARVNSVGFSYDGAFIVASSRKKIGYFEVSRLREQNKNQNKEHEQFGHVNMNGKLAEKQEEGSVALNCVILEEGSLNYSFLVTRFSPGNFIYAVSRCAE